MAGYLPTAYYRTVRYLRPTNLVGYWILGDQPDEAVSLQDVGRYNINVPVGNIVDGALGYPALADSNTSLYLSPYGRFAYPTSDLNTKINLSDNSIGFGFWFEASDSTEWETLNGHPIFSLRYFSGFVLAGVFLSKSSANPNELEFVADSTNYTAFSTPTGPTFFYIDINAVAGKARLWVNGSLEVVADLAPSYSETNIYDLYLGNDSAQVFRGNFGHLTVWRGTVGEDPLNAGEISILANSGITYPADPPETPDLLLRGDVVKVRVVDKATNLLVAELDAESVSVVRTQSDAGTFSFTVPVFMPNAQSLENSVRCYILLNGVEVMHGMVRAVQYTFGDAGVSYRVDGMGELSDLSDIRGKSDASYDGVTLVAILNDLLTRAPGWALGDTGTMVDPLAVTTIDLRDEERLFAQITKAIGAVPNAWFRYGGTDPLGNYLIDIGEFGEFSNIELSQVQDAAEASNRARPNWGGIIELNRKEDRSNVLHQIEAYGGTYEDASGQDQRVTLEDAAAGNPSLLYDPNYPIVDTGNGYVVRSALNYPDIGGEVVRTYDEHVPADDTAPSVTEIMNAGLALYEHAVRDLQLAAYPEDTYSAKVAALTFASNYEINPYYVPPTSFLLFEDDYSLGSVDPNYVLYNIASSYIAGGAWFLTPVGPSPSDGTVSYALQRYAYAGDQITVDVKITNSTATLGVVAIRLEDADNPATFYREVLPMLPADSTQYDYSVSWTLGPGEQVANLQLVIELLRDIELEFDDLAITYYPYLFTIPGFSLRTVGYLPKVGDELQVTASQFNVYLDRAMDIMTTLTGFGINTRLRLLSITLDAGKDRDTIYSMDLSTGKDRIPVDPIVQIYDAIKPPKRRRSGAYLDVLPGGVVGNSGSAGPGVAADDTLSDSTPAKQITVTLPATPPGATSVTLAALPTITPSNRWEFVQLPALPATPLIVKVAGALPVEAWGVGDSATVDATFLFKA